MPPEPPSPLDIWLLDSPLRVSFNSSHGSPQDTKQSEALLAHTLRDSVHRMPWRTDGEMQVFRKEIAAANQSGKMRVAQSALNYPSLVAAQ